MTETHTPGPWRVGKTASKFTPRYTFYDASGAIFTMSVFGTKEKQGDKFAAMIEAAPDMLAALEIVVISGQNSARITEQGDVTIARPAWDDVRAAIAKARGTP